MTVRFFRVTMKGTDGTKLGLVKTWIESQIESQDIALGEGGVSLGEDPIEDTGVFILNCDLYLHESVDVDKYLNLVEAHSNQLDKSGIESIKVIQYDNCSHDSANPQPCSPDTRFEWVSS